MNRYQLAVADMDRRHRLLVRWLSFAGAAALVVLALWSAGVPIFDWWTRAREGTVSPAAPVADTSPSAPIPVTLPRNPAPVADAAGPPPDASVPSTPQPLFLVATVPGRNKTEGTARIGINVEQPQTYVAGAMLANGARLAEIYADRVVLERGDKRLTLYLRNDARANKPATGTAELAMLGGEVAALPSKAKPVQERLTDVIRSMPFYENDMLVGIQVFPGRQSGVFAQLGLQADDVIVALDGAPVADARNAMAMLRTLSGGVAMTVSVRRRGETRTIALDGGLVAKATARADTISSSGAAIQ